MSLSLLALYIPFVILIVVLLLLYRVIAKQ